MPSDLHCVVPRIANVAMYVVVVVFFVALVLSHWFCLIGMFLFSFYLVTLSDIVCRSCIEVLQFETCFVLRIGGALVERRNIGAMG